MNNPVTALLYSQSDGNGVEVILRDETIWATQRSIAELFGVNVPAISKHISNICSEGELQKDSTVSKMEIIRREGDRDVKRIVEIYNLDMIISVGYRVNSQKATNFRIWATKVLKEYTIKGFAMDDERLKRASVPFDKDYFDELLERVRSIRASERRIWQKITDIYAECSMDYDKNSPTTRNFYAMVQNKFHYAITGQTASEIIYNQADHTEANMGLKTWKLAPDGAIRQSDVIVAKNYLGEKDIRRLERAVTGYFDYVEDLIENGQGFTMEQFAQSVDEFLNFRKYKILSGKGSVSRESAEAKAKSEYEMYKRTQRYISDFDRLLIESKNGDDDDS
ncbi:MAG: virulence RhuM family protein [Candidatus Methanomethylophilaceae archaeon]|nr:virulence RhuM family protein [Candidatus Methanomethylophilaceae archaeon]MBR6038192.1 virulence RhuM family protein [Candidatus Methanomethylophilaceae archaeon]